MKKPSRLSRYDITEERIAAREKEGRGKGRGADYIPWIQANDISSRSLTCRVPSRLTGRIHHLLSNLELRAFLDFEFLEQVVDIREQFKLEREETRRLADLLGFKHPRSPKTGIDIVMTTDFLLTFADHDGNTWEKAVSVKYRDEFNKPRGDRRVREKFEIERRYWQLRGIPFEAYTDEEASPHRDRFAGYGQIRCRRPDIALLSAGPRSRDGFPRASARLDKDRMSEKRKASPALFELLQGRR